ncbi:hypothetical protein DYU11_21145 [Fibrisoma montanum]|uniref:Uncharacterized protein n=1 Tax=Fibrisoma montanum TaxID=2305895 RepID=A0A418M4G0_9BACT|nr:hypothetical protein [Fibrisoma montanum]RIV20554.1 hypothetical protein DYU11_21145 [Fibrisoma montanum]
MSSLKDFRHEILRKFNAGTPVSILGFYGLFSTGLLIKVRAGLERDHDAACAGDRSRPPVEWITERIRIINLVLEDREAQRPRTAEEKVWDRVESGQARTVKRWNVHVWRRNQQSAT